MRIIMTLIFDPPLFTLFNLVQVKKPGHLIRQRWALAFCLRMISVTTNYEAGHNEFCNNRSTEGSLKTVYLSSGCIDLCIPGKNSKSFRNSI